MSILLRDDAQDSAPVAGPVISFGPEGHPPPDGLADAYGATLVSPAVLQAASDRSEEPTAWGTSPLARVKPAALSAAYGATLIGSPGLRTAIELKTPLTSANWRNGAWLDMAGLLSAMRDRGFEPEAVEPAVPETSARTHRDRPVACKSANRRLTLWLQVSSTLDQPYTLLILDDDNGTHVLPGRTVTAAVAVQTVDAFLAGLKLTADRAR